MVEDRHHVRAIHAQAFADLLLGQWRELRYARQHGVVVKVQPSFGEPGGDHPLGITVHPAE
jgi:hypothetical protein